MSMIGGMFSGGKGTDFQAGTADIIAPVTQEQATKAYGNAQSGLDQQQALVNALTAQGGIQKQTDVFNQMQGVANGTGPNPAQAALAQATAANTANQAALMAGQRGAGANVGLMARQAAMQGGANQQAAAGQGATMQAQQSLNALNQLGGQAGQMVGQQTGAVGNYNQFAQGEQNTLLNSIAQANNARVNMQGNVNSANAAIAGVNAKGQQDMVGGLMSSMGSMGGMMGGGSGGGGGSSGGGMGSMMGMAAMAAEGGMVPKYADGGTAGDPDAAFRNFGGDPNAPINYKGEEGGPQVTPATNNTAMPSRELGQDPNAESTFHAAPQDGPSSFVGQHLAGIEQPNQLNQANTQVATPQQSSEHSALYKGAASMSSMGNNKQAHGGIVPSKVSPGEVYLPPRDVKKVAQGKKQPLDGEKIPGKPKYKGNNYANDTVDKNLESGGIVIPNSVIQSKDPHKAAAKFVAAVLAKQGMKKKAK